MKSFAAVNLAKQEASVEKLNEKTKKQKYKQSTNNKISTNLKK